MALTFENDVICTVTLSFVSILARHGALKCSKGIISLSERNIFPRENTIFISLENYYKNHQKCNITLNYIIIIITQEGS